MPIIIAILLGLSALLIVVYPLLGLDADGARSAVGSDALADVAERERSAKMALRDVDFDYRLGNLEENDYTALRSRYERRALAALRTRYEREQALDRLIDEQLAALQEKKIGRNSSSAALARENGDDQGAPSGAEKRSQQANMSAKSGHARLAGPTRSRRRKGGAA